MNRIFVYLLILLLYIAVPTLAQPRYLYTQYTTENGLPSNGIKGMLLDSTTGFLWVATEAGLTRFNGNDFRIFNEGRQKQVITDRMFFLFQNYNGHIYAADKLLHLYRIQKQEPVFVDSSATAPNLFETAYLLYVSQKMFDSRLKKKNGIFIHPVFGYSKILPVSDTAALAITNATQELYYYSQRNPDPRLLTPPAGSIKDIFMINKHFFVADADKNIYEFAPSGFGFKKVYTGFSALRSDLIFWQTGTKEPVYVSGNDAFTLRFEHGTLYRDLICDSLPLGINIGLAQYNKAIKTLLLGTLSSGLFIIKENSVESIRRPLGKGNIPESYYAQMQLPNGNLLLNIGQQVGKKPMMKDVPIKGAFGHFTYNDGDSIFWYTKVKTIANKKTDTYLHAYYKKTGKTAVFSKSPVDFASPIQRCGDSLYVFSAKGLYLLQNDSLILVNNQFCKDTDHPSDMIEIKPGVLGISTRDYVFLYDVYTNKTDTILVNKTVDIRKIWVYEDYIFIGTYGGGIYVYHNGKTKAIPLDKNRHLLFAHCFVKDEYGYCWISSNKGLFKARLSDIINAFESNRTDKAIVYYHYFGKANGMGITEMNGGCEPCAVVMEDKTISFPTMQGLLWVNPSFAKPGTPWNNIYIDAISANRVNINPDSLQYIKLPSHTKEIRLKIAYPVWENTENVYIQYRLAKDSSWKWMEPGGNIILNSPGYDDHILQIRKIRGFGTGNITTMQLPFSIARPVYAQWWFYIVAGCCGLGLIYLYMRLRTRHYIMRERKLENLVAKKTKELREQNIELEKRDAIKTRLIAIINHDIITPLKFLSATGKNLKEKRKMMNEKIQDETIDEIVNTSKELQILSTNILNWIKYHSEGKGLQKENFLVHEMACEIFKLLGPVAHLKKLQSINAIKPQLKIYQYYDPLKVLVYNLVSNSIKFTQEGSVIIGAEATDTQVTIWVSDQGIGMTETQVHNLLIGKTHIHSIKNNPGAGHGLGYQIIRDLLNITGSTITIESDQGKGTTVLIRFAKTLPEKDDQDYFFDYDNKEPDRID